MSNLQMVIVKDQADRHTKLHFIWANSFEKVCVISEVDLVMYREPKEVIENELRSVLVWMTDELQVSWEVALHELQAFYTALAEHFLPKLEPVTAYIRTKAEEKGEPVDEAVRAPLPEARLVQSFTEGLAKSIKAMFSG